MVWHARLNLDYALRSDATRLHFAHDGPLRVLRSLYPEGDAVCHNVLVHPPGGIVGGDVLDIGMQVAEGAHALVTTPGATRFYRSNGALGTQRTRITLAPGARLEWLPLEAIAYPACDALNELQFDLAPDAQLITWDITALGLPHADAPFDTGRFVQHIEWPGRFLERGVLDAQDARLMNGPLGLAGQRCLASLVLASGTPLPRALREQLLEATHALLDGAPEGVIAGVTSPQPHMLVLRGLAPVVEPLMQLWQRVWAEWRQRWWGLPAVRPRIWAM
ncbi:Urease accessory protein UreD [bioreactor metagenome]|uniref:Urease accessory protein UreD n=1 Tax=bioreactor metagenome TaxID=1076179 RepID=A0A645A1A9_9ZZZZ